MLQNTAIDFTNPEQMVKAHELPGEAVGRILHQKEAIRRLINESMVSGVDYETDPRSGKRVPRRPALIQVMGLLRMRPGAYRDIHVIRETALDAPFFYFEIEVSLFDCETGLEIGMGQGVCHTREKSFSKKGGEDSSYVWESVHRCRAVACKRALMAAVCNATMLLPVLAEPDAPRNGKPTAPTNNGSTSPKNAANDVEHMADELAELQTRLAISGDQVRSILKRLNPAWNRARDALDSMSWDELKQRIEEEATKPAAPRNGKTEQATEEPLFPDDERPALHIDRPPNAGDIVRTPGGIVGKVHRTQILQVDGKDVTKVYLEQNKVVAIDAEDCEILEVSNLEKNAGKIPHPFTGEPLPSEQQPQGTSIRGVKPKKTAKSAEPEPADIPDELPRAQSKFSGIDLSRAPEDGPEPEASDDSK